MNRLTQDQKLCRKRAREEGRRAIRFAEDFGDTVAAYDFAKSSATYAFASRPDLRESRYEPISDKQRAWETAMGMRGYVGSPAQREEAR